MISWNAIKELCPQFKCGEAIPKMFQPKWAWQKQLDWCWQVDVFTSPDVVGVLLPVRGRGVSHISQLVIRGWLRRVQLLQAHCSDSSIAFSWCGREGRGGTEGGVRATNKQNNLFPDKFTQKWENLMYSYVRTSMTHIPTSLQTLYTRDSQMFVLRSKHSNWYYTVQRRYYCSHSTITTTFTT